MDKARGWYNTGTQCLTSSKEIKTRAGLITLIGAPNVGKSTLLNQLVGAKVSIVTHKVQTTRRRVHGIVICNNDQFIFVDTPGIFESRRPLDHVMVNKTWRQIKNSDVVCLVIDSAKGLKGESEVILRKISCIKLPKILLINKIDRVKREKLFQLVINANEYTYFDNTFMISALNGDGCKDILNHIRNFLPVVPWLYPPNQVSNVSQRMLSSEITREKLYLCLHQELPYSARVEVECWEEKIDGSLKIDQTIYIERLSQKRILIGNKGKTIKRISSMARKELSELLKRQVHLFLLVKVRERWVDNSEPDPEMGLSFLD
ncbi:GTPase Era [Candidatus Endowatersipora endosymbiont of Watersipora subatra]|uniref:GTPase Era n=1 Tax=Candidatus Endowatersipora endosymbiont of Watersipora subatra TaxID=3077946 RepID=UPI00312CBE2F